MVLKLSDQEYIRNLEDKVDFLHNAIKELEWSHYDDKQNKFRCIGCYKKQEDGHATNCIVSDAMEI